MPKNCNLYVLPRAARPFLRGSPESVSILRFMLSDSARFSFTAPEIRDALGLDNKYNLNRYLQQLKWRSLIEKETPVEPDKLNRWKVIDAYRSSLIAFLEELDRE